MSKYIVDIHGEIEGDYEIIGKYEEKEPTTKENLAVDCISRADARKAIIDHQYSDSFCEEHNIDHSINTGMALIALSDLPPTTPTNAECVDCISRKAVKGYIHAYIHEIITESGTDKNAHTNGVLRALLNGVDTMPSVTPVRPKGHWISHREHCEMNNLIPSGLGILYWCSECDCAIDSKYFHRVNYNYCPNCGSDNREVEE